MSFKLLVMAGIENLLNTFLYRSPTLETAHSCLLGKILHMEVKGFSASLTLAFSGRQADVLDKWAGDADYIVIAYASMLSKLRDRQQPTTPTRNGELEVQGDIQVMQNFVALADLAEFDPARLLALYTGDIAAGGISKATRGGVKFLHHGIRRQQRYVAEAITEKWHMMPDPLEVTWFVEETAAVKCVVDILTERLGKLKAR